MAQAAGDWFGAELFGNGGARDNVAWRGAHEALLRLAEKRAGLDFEEGRCLLAALRAGTNCGSCIPEIQGIIGEVAKKTA